MKNWRVILDGNRSASFNMAADAFFLKAAEREGSVPVLRLYGWDRPSITIGYHQAFERAVDVARLGETPVVRRVTGGRALLHDDGELTYALAGNFLDYPELGQALHDSYHLISDAVVSFYTGLGWAASVSHRDRPLKLGAAASTQKGCFASVSRHEITIGAGKMAAGSQRRTKRAFVQHGAIKIAPPGNHPAIEWLAQADEYEALKPLEADSKELRRRLLMEFEKVYRVSFIEKPFTALEMAAIERLQAHFTNLNSL